MFNRDSKQVSKQNSTINFFWDSTGRLIETFWKKVDQETLEYTFLGTTYDWYYAWIFCSTWMYMSHIHAFTAKCKARWKDFCRLSWSPHIFTNSRSWLPNFHAQPEKNKIHFVSWSSHINNQFWILNLPIFFTIFLKGCKFFSFS